MNPKQFRTVLWLRWRLLVNRMKRGGIANLIILILLAFFGGLLAVVGFGILFWVGGWLLTTEPPAVVLFVWDGVVVVYLFFWSIGVLVELQRAEALTLDKFLHLPVSLTSVFLINYLSSLLSLSTVLFVPAMVGLGVGLALGRGPLMLLTLPLAAALLLMVTALTYQFQGWLASMMTNPRRRRTVIAVVTTVCVLIFQLPNLANMIWLRNRPAEPAQAVPQETEFDRELATLDRARQQGRINEAEYNTRRAEVVQRRDAAREARDREDLEEAARTGWIINLCLPPGWLPLGAMGLADGRVLPALLGMLGMGLIGTASLWRSYRTTVRIYTGHFTAGKPHAANAATPQRGEPSPPPFTRAGPGGAAAPARVRLLERRPPWLSERAAAIALASFRSLTRAPEVKMLLLTPFILAVVFGSMLFTRKAPVPEMARPLVAFGAMVMPMLTMIQLVGNQFGFDRSGFRVFVLCPADRRDILLGKNLAVAPLALVLGLILLVVIDVVEPLRPDLFLAALPQWVSMYLLFCLLANLLSILVPMPVAAGSLRHAQPKLLPALAHVAFLLVLTPLMSLTLLPLAVEFLLGRAGLARGVPVCLILSLAECVGIVLFYRVALGWEGELLQAWEQKILQTVTTRAE